MKKRLFAIVLALALAVSMIPTCFAYYTASDTKPTPSQPWYGIVKAEEGCNIRQSNAEDSTYLGSLTKGTYVHIVGKNWNWYVLSVRISPQSKFSCALMPMEGLHPMRLLQSWN